MYMFSKCCLKVCALGIQMPIYHVNKAFWIKPINYWLLSVNVSIFWIWISFRTQRSDFHKESCLYWSHMKELFISFYFWETLIPKMLPSWYWRHTRVTLKYPGAIIHCECVGGYRTPTVLSQGVITGKKYTQSLLEAKITESRLQHSKKTVLHS